MYDMGHWPPKSCSAVTTIIIHSDRGSRVEQEYCQHAAWQDGRKRHPVL